jgi:hypothetical protein
VFSYSATARYTTLAKVQGKTAGHHPFSWRLPGKGKESLKSGQCDSFTVRNPTAAPLNLKLFDEIHAAAKLTLEIAPAAK